ncbi:MAG: AbrB/MazE/SpoVT family DNA-binding domain-containing protein [Actinobacteria bacterium]|nr:AbrB/MazE/SpoVT family DNA-binding domain-containing protein [Actinomycetota bacterium]
MNTSTISAKGWVVIPKELRERFGLKKGDKVHFVEYGGTIALVPLSKDAIKESAGMLKGDTSLLSALLKTRQEDAAKGR